jgi:formate dehydrogenase assembly factor FdhD
VAARKTPKKTAYDLIKAMADSEELFPGPKRAAKKAAAKKATTKRASKKAAKKAAKRAPAATVNIQDAQIHDMLAALTAAMNLADETQATHGWAAVEMRLGTTRLVITFDTNESFVPALPQLRVGRLVRGRLAWDRPSYPTS